MDPLKSEVLCRICLSDEIEQIEFYSIHTKLSDKTIAEMFSAVSGFHCLENDPQVICRPCWSNLLISYEFIKLSRSTEQELRRSSSFDRSEVVDVQAKHNSLEKVQQNAENNSQKRRSKPLSTLRLIETEIIHIFYQDSILTRSEVEKREKMDGKITPKREIRHEAQKQENKFRCNGSLAKKAKFFCKICDILFASVRERQLHMFEIHKKLSKGVITKCHICGFKIPNRKGMGNNGSLMVAHYRKKHPGVEMILPQIPIDKPKKVSNENFKDASSIVQQDMLDEKIRITFYPEESAQIDNNQHVEESESRYKGDDTPMEESKTPTEKSPQHFSCNFCWEEYDGQCQCPPEPLLEIRNVEIPDRHSLSGPSLMICEHCGRQYEKIGSFRSHVNSCSKDREICEHCGAAFRTRTNLNEHLLCHENQNQVECDICGRKFLAKKRLLAHMDTHNTYLKYECSICKKRLKSKKTLTWHKKTHTMEKDYECPVEGCSAAFVVNATLRSHIQKHHPERPLPPKGTIVSKKAKEQLQYRLKLNDNNSAFAIVKYRGVNAEY